MIFTQVHTWFSGIHLTSPEHLTCKTVTNFTWTAAVDQGVRSHRPRYHTRARLHRLPRLRDATLADNWWPHSGNLLLRLSISTRRRSSIRFCIDLNFQSPCKINLEQRSVRKMEYWSRNKRIWPIALSLPFPLTRLIINVLKRRCEGS